MNDFLRKNAMTLSIICITWAFSIGFVKASVETRLDIVEEEIAEVEHTVNELKEVTTRLEVIVGRLEKMADN